MTRPSPDRLASSALIAVGLVRAVALIGLTLFVIDEFTDFFNLGSSIGILCAAIVIVSRFEMNRISEYLNDKDYY